MGVPARSVLRIATGHPAILAGARVIRPGDEAALLPGESSASSDAGDGVAACVRQASGAARIVARHLLRELGLTTAPLARRRLAPPVWPEGIAGSLSHDATLAVAAVASTDTVLALGIDVEPDEPLEAELVPLVSTAAERAGLVASTGDARRRACRRLVAAKEAAYKAAFAIDGTFLDWHDIEVDLGSGVAALASGRRVPVLVAPFAGHVVALARIDA